MTGRFWDRLAPLLDGFADGEVLAPDMPGRRDTPAPDGLGALTVDQEVESVLADVEAAQLPEPIVVVAHSSGGLPVPGVVAGLRERGVEVSAIVLNAASVPPEGGCGVECMQDRHAEGVRLAYELAAGDAEKLRVLGMPSDREKFRRSYGGEPLDDETLEWILDPERLVEDTMNLYFQPVRWSQVPDDIPITYIVNTLDRAMPADKQEAMAARLPGTPTVVHLECGHIPPVTDPAGFAELLRNVV